MTTQRYPFTPYPAGWFRIASASELEPGAVVPRTVFGQEAVLFRTESGTIRLMEAHCPHLGAHLGHGGRVDGEQIVCPFHGWRLSAEGQVVDVPYSERRPPKVCLRTWPLREVAGQVLAWHHPHGAEPTWEPPEIPEADDPDWTPFWPAKRWRIKTHIQELAENGSDNAHFSHLHHQQTLGMDTTGLTVDGHKLVHHTFQRFNLFGLAKLMVDKVEGPLDIELHGLGIFVNRATVNAGITLEYTFVFYPTPIDDETVEFVSFLSMRKLWCKATTLYLWRKAAKEGAHTIDQDVPIWENKQYRPRPVLVAEDGPLRQFRSWARQFYPAQKVAELEQVG